MKLNIPVDQTTLAWLGRLRGNRTWTETIEQLKPASIPAWTFSLDDVGAALSQLPVHAPYRTLLDFNEESKINSGDQAAWTALGVPQHAVVVPPPTGGLQTIIDDATLPHEGGICGTAGYDWEHRRAVQRARSGGIRAMTGWMVAEHPCGGPQTGTRVRCRNRRTWLYENGVYSLEQVGVAGPNWHAVMNTMTNAFESGDAQWRDEGGGEVSFVIPPDRSVHFAGPNNRIPAGDQYILCVAEYKLDAADANIIANTGADWRDPGPVGAVVGRFKRVTTSWALHTATTIPLSELQAHPPPLP